MTNDVASSGLTLKQNCQIAHKNKQRIKGEETNQTRIVNAFPRARSIYDSRQYTGKWGLRLQITKKVNVVAGFFSLPAR